MFTEAYLPSQSTSVRRCEKKKKNTRNDRAGATLSMRFMNVVFLWSCILFSSLFFLIFCWDLIKLTVNGVCTVACGNCKWKRNENWQAWNNQISHYLIFLLWLIQHWRRWWTDKEREIDEKRKLCNSNKLSLSLVLNELKKITLCGLGLEFRWRHVAANWNELIFSKRMSFCDIHSLSHHRQTTTQNQSIWTLWSVQNY